MQRIDDGHSTRILFSNYPSVKVWEKEVTPPGISGGGENDTTTMHNTVWRTRAPKKLKTLTPMSSTVAYDPEAYDDLVAMIQENQEITVQFPDSSTLTFWGWLDEFTPGAAAEGSQPTASITVIPSNQNANGEEVGPEYGEPSEAS